jgi:preprotein translocase subunit SecA
LHQAIEAKEGVEVKRESQTLATVSFQNLFRMYNKLSGMTGTAATEAEEFFKIYTLDVVEIPSNKPVVRIDNQDKIYKTEAGKLDAVVRDIKECVEKGQPVLVGTVSVEKNEQISKLLKKAGVKHEILNAKNHEREAKIIIKAGLKGSITVATNMAGRGTDIKLGEGVREAGGLHVIGTERHEARRIDNQLRGRAGRQGDPGSSQFYVSLEDDLMRIFGGEKIKVMMDRLGLPEDQPIENKLISRSIEGAQRKVEGYNFDIRKNLVEYDDVMNKHREVIYRKRRKILEQSLKPDESIKDEILGIINDEIERIINRNIEDKEKTIGELKIIFGDMKFEDLSLDSLKKLARDQYTEREKRFGVEMMRNIERAIYLRTIDNLWVEHLTTMDELREGIGLRGYGQRDPLVEYKSESYRLFESLIAMIESTVSRTIFKVEVQVQPTAPIVRRPLEYKAPDPDTIGDIKKDEPMLEEEMREEAESSSAPSQTSVNNSGVTTTIRGPKESSIHDRMMSSAGKQHTIKSNAKVGRNDPCPCGSGKKYKKCCGK